MVAVHSTEANADGRPVVIDLRRCWGCRLLRPRGSMQWGHVAHGTRADPLWNPRLVRVLYCADCLSERPAA